jgi:hypothetical protein
MYVKSLFPSRPLIRQDHFLLCGCVQYGFKCMYLGYTFSSRTMGKPDGAWAQNALKLVSAIILVTHVSSSNFQLLHPQFQLCQTQRSMLRCLTSTSNQKFKWHTSKISCGMVAAVLKVNVWHNRKSLFALLLSCWNPKTALFTVDQCQCHIQDQNHNTPFVMALISWEL